MIELPLRVSSENMIEESLRGLVFGPLFGSFLLLPGFVAAMASLSIQKVRSWNCDQTYNLMASFRKAMCSRAPFFVESYCISPHTTRQIPGHLGRWLYSQKLKACKGTLPSQRKRKLLELGVELEKGHGCEALHLGALIGGKYDR